MNKNIKKTYIAPKIEFLEIQMQATTTVGASGTANLGNFGSGGELGGSAVGGIINPGNNGGIGD